VHISPLSYHAQWLHRPVLLPSGSRGVVMGFVYDRLDVRYANGGKVTIHPHLVKVTDGKPRPTE
jgi:hypothetical protein